jgi:hypothetical protein
MKINIDLQVEIKNIMQINIDLQVKLKTNANKY